MPAKSQKQGSFFRLVRLCQRDGKCLSPEISKAAKSISDEDAHDFAKTKNKGLPKRVEKRDKKKMEHASFDNWVRERDPSLVSEVGTTTADIAMFKRMTLPAVRRQFASFFDKEDDFFKKKRVHDSCLEI